jgi:thiamine biosynthesis lipoprotein
MHFQGAVRSLCPVVWTAWVLAAFPAQAEAWRFQRELMGTRFTIVCCSGDHDTAKQAAAVAFEVAEGMNRVASDYRPDSELTRLASVPVSQPVVLSPLLFDVLEHSRALAAATNGAFDPTLGPLTRLWRQTRQQRDLPGVAVLEAARAATGWRHFSLDPTSRCVTLHRQGMSFDLGGVAKGYAADLMLESLAADGMRHAMVAAGGDIRLGDPPPGREGWRVAVQTVDLTRHDEVRVLANAAVSTSGDLHQWVEIEGVRYSHILDPATGLGLTRRLAATVIADTAKLSDALATAACVMGPDAAEVLHRLPGVREVKIRVVEVAPPGHRKER